MDFGKLKLRLQKVNCIGYISISVLSGDIQVGHDSKCTWANNDKVNEYLAKRHPTGQIRKDLFHSIEQLWYQRSYLSCVADLGQ